ncbi:MAG: DUF86 domain-containing protein [Actinomycetaceae bacterium]|nr:DUF86 domain-containing protein [Actinomycetaceae bacterium]
MQRSDILFLTEMRDACCRILEIVASSTPQELPNDVLRIDALKWNFTVLGEAASKVSANFKRAHPEIPWRNSIDTRNRVVHGYWSLDLDILVTTAKEHLPVLVQDLDALLMDTVRDL